jgi:tRNA(His) 5'-end guanylyltransferase
LISFASQTIKDDRFSDIHTFQKPYDERALMLMDHSARAVMEEYKDAVLAFGESDEYRSDDPFVDFLNPPENK